MFSKLSAIAVLCFGYAQAANWAVLLAGSNTWSNYRHQSDVFHAYQILKTRGDFPESNIITLAYDDIANYAYNPKKGQVFNKPNGPDVYNGVVIDYKGNDVTAANFLNVLSGNKAALAGKGTGKVLEATSEDNVFVYYSDHGAFGFIGMPVGDYLYANDLNKVLGDLAAQNKFKSLAFYLEACESGSMFENILPNNTNIWAITAANSQESSYAYYYDSTIGAYLGDEFSIQWMESAEISTLESVDFSLQQHFETIQKATQLSHVCKFGQDDLGSLPVGQFLLFEKFLSNKNSARSLRASSSSSRTNVRELEVELLKRRISESSNPREISELQSLLEQELASRSKLDTQFATISALITKDYKTIEHPYSTPRDFDCLKATVRHFEAQCGSLQGYGFKYGKTLSALCDLEYGVENIKSAINQACPASM